MKLCQFLAKIYLASSPINICQQVDLNQYLQRELFELYILVANGIFFRVHLDINAV